MDEFKSSVAGLLVDQCLQFPIYTALVFSLGFYVVVPIITDPGHSARTEGRRWAVSCLVIFGLLGATLTWFIPALQLTASRIIFRPTPSCSTFNNPARYLAFILDHNDNQVFYVTTTSAVEKTDPHMKEAAPFYIISSWIRSPNHYRIVSEKISFQPASVKGMNKPPYELKKGYCVRAAGPTSADPLLVAFYSLNGTETILEDTGYIAKKDLEEFQSGWFYVSNCRTELTRWLFRCKNGYVSSAYVRYTEYTRGILRVDGTTSTNTVQESNPPYTSLHEQQLESGNKEEKLSIPSQSDFNKPGDEKSHEQDLKPE